MRRRPPTSSCGGRAPWEALPRRDGAPAPRRGAGRDDGPGPGRERLRRVRRRRGAWPRRGTTRAAGPGAGRHGRGVPHPRPPAGARSPRPPPRRLHRAAWRRRRRTTARWREAAAGAGGPGMGLRAGAPVRARSPSVELPDEAEPSRSRPEPTRAVVAARAGRLALPSAASQRFDADRDEVIGPRRGGRRRADAGAGLRPAALREAALELADRHPAVIHAAVGIHPHFVGRASTRRTGRARGARRVAGRRGGGGDRARLLPQPVAAGGPARGLRPAAGARRAPAASRCWSTTATRTTTSAPALLGVDAVAACCTHSPATRIMAREMTAAGFRSSLRAARDVQLGGRAPRAAAAAIPDGQLPGRDRFAVAGTRRRRGRNEPTTALRVATELARLRGVRPEEIATPGSRRLRSPARRLSDRPAVARALHCNGDRVAVPKRAGDEKEDEALGQVNVNTPSSELRADSEWLRLRLHPRHPGRDLVIARWSASSSLRITAAAPRTTPPPPDGGAASAADQVRLSPRPNASAAR